MCKTNAAYKVNLEVLDTTTFEDLNYIKTMINDKEPVILTSNLEIETTLDNAVHSYTLKKGYLGQDESVTYDLRLWMDEDTPANDAYMEKTLKSKITITGESYPKEIDRTPPVVNFTTTETDEGILVDASTSTDDNSGIAAYYYSKDGEVWTKSSSATFLLKNGSEVTYGNGVEVIKQLANLRVNDVYVKIEDEFENMSEVVSKNIRLGELVYDKTVDNNIRYIGPNPNNYVTFNNESWRIIGSFNNILDGQGNKTSRLKLIRSTSIGNMAWNSANNNNWATASLKTYLNETYYESFSDETKEKVDNAIWTIGRVDLKEDLTVNQYYSRERTVSGGYSSTWAGKIALPYPSDFAFATNGNGSLSGRTNCLNRTLIDGWINNYGNCGKSSWLHTPKMQFLTILSTSGLVVSIESTSGRIHYGGVIVSVPQKPTLYLAENIKIISGTGTSADPFQLSF